MAAQVLQGLFCFVVALLHYVTPAPTTTGVTSTSTGPSKSTQKPVTSSEAAVNFTQTLVPSTDPSTIISTVTASKLKLFGKLRQIKKKEAKLQSKLDGDFVVSGTPTATKTSVTPTSSTTQLVTSPLLISSTATHLKENFKTASTPQRTSLPSFKPKTDGILSKLQSTTQTATVSSQISTVMSQTATGMSQTTTMMSQTATVPSQAGTATSQMTTPASQSTSASGQNLTVTPTKGSEEDDGDNDDDKLDYEDEYDGEEDWFKTNDITWGFDDKSLEEEEYNEIYDPGSGEKFRQSFLNDVRTKPFRLPWE